ncbi:MAG: N-succinylarginine dihydrolase [Myxococcales bacterium]|nr:N-succinylarginine dihydrolase [Myxococcales bacterium]
MSALGVCCFDGLPGPTHSYAGLSPGNLAATEHAGQLGNPKAAALQGLAKMRLVRDLGIPQAVLPPQPRPDVRALRRLGFTGTDAEVIARAASTDGARLLRLVSSASAMWTANAATVASSADCADGRVHLTVANLSSLFHRSLEAPATLRVLRSIFADERRFVVHDPLPSGDLFADEGAANHIRLETSRGAAHLFAWGRSALREAPLPRRHPARQTLEASQALARLHCLSDAQALFPQQDPLGIDAGAFHTDVLAVGLSGFLMLHERAFVNPEAVIDTLRERLGAELVVALAREADVPLADAVSTYLFNSELCALAGGRMALVAPKEAESSAPARRFLDRLVAEPTPVDRVVFVDVNASMKNGGGPACLRLAVPLTDEERGAIRARVFLDEALERELSAWVEKHYRDRLALEDLADPSLHAEGLTALDELTSLLGLGSVYDFQI